MGKGGWGVCPFLYGISPSPIDRQYNHMHVDRHFGDINAASDDAPPHSMPPFPPFDSGFLFFSFVLPPLLSCFYVSFSLYRNKKGGSFPSACRWKKKGKVSFPVFSFLYSFSFRLCHTFLCTPEILVLALSLTSQHGINAVLRRRLIALSAANNSFFFGCEVRPGTFWVVLIGL